MMEKKMKIKMRDFFEGNLPAAMSKLGSCTDLKDLATSMRVALAVKKYVDKSEEVQKIYQEKVKPFLSGETDNQGNPLILPERVEAFQQQQRELFDVDTELDVALFSVDDFGGCKLSPFELIALKDAGFVE